MRMNSSDSTLTSPSRDDSTGVEDRETLGDVANEIEVLLDQQNCAVPLPGDALQEHVDLLDDGRLQSLGGFVEQEQFRLLDKGAGDRQLLLLSAGQDAALALGQGRECREIVEDKIGNLVGLLRLCRATPQKCFPRR